MVFDKNKNQILDLIFAPCTSLVFFVLSSLKNPFFIIPLSFDSVEKSQQDFFSSTVQQLLHTVCGMLLPKSDLFLFNFGEGKGWSEREEGEGKRP